MATQSTDIPANKNVSIVITPDNRLVIEPAVPAVREALTYIQLVHEPGGPCGYKPSSTYVPMYDHDQAGRLVTWCGLLDRVCQLLKQLGYTVTIEDQLPKGGWPRPSWHVQSQAEPADHALLEALPGTRQGQVEVSGFAEMARQIALVCRFFPDVPILMMAATRKLVYQVWRAVQPQVREKIHVATQSPWRTSCRIVIGTVQSAEPRDPSQWQILLLPSIEQLAGKEAVERLTTLGAIRTYGFVTAGQHLSRRTMLHIEAIAGPVIYSTVPQAAGVYVGMLTMPGTKAANGKKGAKPLTALERKRQLYFNNDSRNQLIADAAKALAAGDANTLHKLGILATANDPLPAGPVVILVESVEHAKALQARLPGWQLDHALPADGDTTADSAAQAEDSNPLSDEAVLALAYSPNLETLTHLDLSHCPIGADAVKALANSPNLSHLECLTLGKNPVSKDGPTGRIVTLVHAACHGINAGVLVRAAGDEGSLAVVGFPRKKAEQPQGVWIIDICDTMDAEADRATRSRIKEYLGQDWTVRLPADLAKEF